MRTKIVTLFVLLCSSLSTTIRAQELVIDPALSATIVASTVADGIAYNQIEENQTENTTALAAAGVLQTSLLQIKQTTLTALQEVHTTLQGLASITQMTQAFENSFQILSQIFDLVSEDPTLLAVTYDLYYKLIEEIADVTAPVTYIALNQPENGIGPGSELNLLNSADRLQIINHAKKQAFKIQGILNQMYYRMKAAKKYGLFRILCPREFYYIRHCNQIATRIINNFHL